MVVTVAVYARKSTDQTGVSDEQRSVARQVEHARAYAVRKGWSVADEHVYVDDGISGAEFDRRPGLQRLRAALRPRPAFDVLIVSEQSRLSRDTSDTLRPLKELARARVRVFAYLEDRRISVETAEDTLFTSVNAWKDAQGWREASVRAHDALTRKARAGHVCGGRAFGYRNVDVFSGTDAHGRPLRSHVTREIRPDEAAVVRQIFDLCAAGFGVKRIAARLNEQRAPTPRAQQGRVNGWAPSSVRAVLFNELYRGVLVWNRTRKRETFGQVQPSARDRADWLRVEIPEWWIVTEDAWQAAHARLAAARRTYLRGTHEQSWGRPTSGTAAKYLLTGLARCGVCGGGLTVRSRAHGKAPRSLRYVCSTHHYRGSAVCANGREMRLDVADEAVLDLVEGDILRPTVIEPAVRMALDALMADQPEDRRADLTRRLRSVEGKLAQLTAAVEQGGHLPALRDALRARENEAAQLRGELAALDRVTRWQPGDRRGLERRIREHLANWRGLLRSQVADARRIVEALLEERLTFTPADEGAARFDRLNATFALGRVFNTVFCSQGGSSPTGFEPVFQP